MQTSPSLDAKLFKAFCEENRLMVLQMLCKGETCACRLLKELEIGQSTLSHHMKILCESGVVQSRKEGKWIFYSINKIGLEKAVGRLQLLSALSTSEDTSVFNEDESE